MYFKIMKFINQLHSCPGKQNRWKWSQTKENHIPFPHELFFIKRSQEIFNLNHHKKQLSQKMCQY